MDEDRNRSRVRRFLERLQGRPAAHVGHEHVQDDGVGPLAPRDLEDLRSAGGVRAPRCRARPARPRSGGACSRRRRRRGRAGPSRPAGPARRDGRRLERDRRRGRSPRSAAHARERHGERRAAAGRAPDVHVAAEQHRELANDGEAEARASARAMGARIALTELLEDRLLLRERDADSRVGDHERPARSARAARRGPSTEPASVNFSALPTRFARICASFAGSHGRSRASGRDSVSRRSPLRRAASPKSASTWRSRRRDADDLEPDLRLARLDLGDVEHVVDQAEQQAGVALDALEALALLRRSARPGFRAAAFP